MIRFNEIYYTRFFAFVKLFFQILDLFLFQEVLSQAMLRVYHVTSFFARGKIKFF